MSTVARDAARLREGHIALNDLIAPPVPLPKPRSHVPPACRKILHFAKIVHAKKFRLSPEIGTYAEHIVGFVAGGWMMRLAREGQRKNTCPRKLSARAMTARVAVWRRVSLSRLGASRGASELEHRVPTPLRQHGRCCRAPGIRIRPRARSSTPSLRCASSVHNLLKCINCGVGSTLSDDRVLSTAYLRINCGLS